MGSAPQPLKTSVANGNCAAQGFFGSDKNANPCKVCQACTGEKDKCKLYSHNSGCCGKDEHHHLVPVHCTMPVGERSKNVGDRKVYDGCGAYDDKQAPCLCLSEGDHKAFHREYKKLENSHKVNGKAGTWTYEDSREAAVTVASEHEPKCKPDCIREQLDAYHKDKAHMEGAKLRADSGGRGGDVKLDTVSFRSAISAPVAE